MQAVFVSVKREFFYSARHRQTLGIVTRVLYNHCMSAPILATKLYSPQSRQKVVVRSRLSEQLNEALHRKLTLISAPAGFGKTTLLGEWCNQQSAPIAWLSLDEGDSSPARFLAYLVAALQTIFPSIGKGISAVLQAPQPPPPEAILTVLLNEITAIPDHFILVLDDYHLIDATEVDHALTFLIEHLPPQMHLVIATRQDPQLPLSQLRARVELIELRAADLRFTFSEAAEFLNRVMGLNLSAENIAALETRTEGWVAGLQLAALAMSSNRTMHGQEDVASFIQSFTGSHRFVLDYLLEQVLQQQTQEIQTFLLHTSILERLCGSLCDAVLNVQPGTSKETLLHLERANLFLFPLDNERHWYRYHRLFADLLRQRAQQKFTTASSPDANGVVELHQRASAWYEKNDMPLEAFRHAAAANDVERAARLIDTERIPMHFPGAVNTILDWLHSLPKHVLDARPALWWRAAALSLILGITTGVQEKLQAAEDGLQGADPTDKTRNLIGRIATARATLALTRYDAETILVQSQRALEYLDASNLADRTSAQWTQGIAYFFQGDRVAARKAMHKAFALAQASARNFSLLLVTTSLGTLHEVENELYPAVETYQRALQLAGEPALAFASDAHLGLARIFYEWNDLDAAQAHGESSLVLTRQYDRVIDRDILSEVFLARVRLARGDVDGAAAVLTRLEQTARAKNFLLRLPDIATAQISVLLRQKNLAAAARLTQTFTLPLGQARVLLAQGNADAAWRVLETFRQVTETKGWADERLKTLVLQALARAAQAKHDASLHLLDEALALAEPGGFIRLFVDEGETMRALLVDFQSRLQNQKLKNYTQKILAAFPKASELSKSEIKNQKSEIIEPLSERELEILQLIAQGYSNQEITERLFLALSTVKGHNRIVFDKLHVKNRTEAVARARALGLL